MRRVASITQEASSVELGTWCWPRVVLIEKRPLTESERSSMNRAARSVGARRIRRQGRSNWIWHAPAMRTRLPVQFCRDLARRDRIPAGGVRVSVGAGGCRFGLMVRRKRTPYVASMLHGAAVSRCQLLETQGNIVQHMQHEKAPQPEAQN
jgi:hypothetical protein